MCGRAYETYTEAELASLDDHGEALDIDWLAPNYNIAPSETSPVVLVRNDRRAFARAGLGHERPGGGNVFPYQRAGRRDHRQAKLRGSVSASALRGAPVRLLDWKRDDRHKRPFAIYLRDQPVMAVAGVWERWQPAGQVHPIHSFSIVTTAANILMADIHDRMPVIFDRQNIDPDVHEPERVLPLIRPCPSEWLTAYAVSTSVN